MRVGLIDCSAPAGRIPAFPSPSLLATGGDAEWLAPDADLEGRAIVLAPPWRSAEAARVEASLRGRAVVERLDPWAAPASAPPAYRLARSPCHGEVDLAPGGAPVHPWVTPSAANVDDARLEAAAAALSDDRETALVLGDERVPLTWERLRRLADLVTRNLRERKSLISLHLRVWPADLAGADGERTLAHLPLLPVASFDLLVGSLRDASLAQMGNRLGAREVAEVIAAVERAGLGDVTTLSIACGLPGETVDDAIAVLNDALQLAGRCRFHGVRCALWYGGGAPPADPIEQKQRFLASHPSWSEVEYRGFHDLIAVLRPVAAESGIDVVGPGFLPTWDDVP